jgi:hypothetical protein
MKEQRRRCFISTLLKSPHGVGLKMVVLVIMISLVKGRLFAGSSEQTTGVHSSHSTDSPAAVLLAERDLWRTATLLWEMRASQVLAEANVWQDLFWKRDPEKNKASQVDFSIKADTAQQAYQKARLAAMNACSGVGRKWDEQLLLCGDGPSTSSGEPHGK